MKRIQVDSERLIFTENGRPFFYLADTAWMAFANMSIDEWEEYTDFRRKQGFNVLQISILPIFNDMSTGDMTILPYNFDQNGLMDFLARNEPYFDKAEHMLDIAVEKGFVPALVVLWNNYVPTSWAAERSGNISNMPEGFLREYAGYVAQKFGRFNPIYLISGDTNFETDTITRYYTTLLEEIKRLCPDSLTTMHLTPNGDVPKSICDSTSLDFYMYQSGHFEEYNHYPYLLAEKFCAYEVKRPVINGEPCYEGHGHGGKYARFNAFEVRRATWQSLLSGAKAGITYGAHGIWMFHHSGMHFTSLAFSSMPFPWRDALQFEGAWDIAYARWLFESKKLCDLKPDQLLVDAPESVRSVSSEDHSCIAVYIPYAKEITIRCDLSGYHAEMFLLDKRYATVPCLIFKDGTTTVQMTGYNTDTLLIAKR